MAWGSSYTASSQWINTTTTGTWKDAAGAAMTLPAVPSGSSGTTFVTFLSAAAAPTAVVTVLSTTGFTIGQNAAQSGHIQALVGHSIIA